MAPDVPFDPILTHNGFRRSELRRCSLCSANGLQSLRYTERSTKTATARLSPGAVWRGTHEPAPPMLGWLFEGKYLFKGVYKPRDLGGARGYSIDTYTIIPKYLPNLCTYRYGMAQPCQFPSIS